MSKIKIDHYDKSFGSIKVPVYKCERKDCMFIGKDHKTCGYRFVHISHGKCFDYTPINKERDNI